MVKIQVPDGFDLDSLPYFPPNGQDSAQICSKCQLQFLRLMALPVIEESSYLAFVNVYRCFFHGFSTGESLQHFPNAEVWVGKLLRVFFNEVIASSRVGCLTKLQLPSSMPVTNYLQIHFFACPHIVNQYWLRIYSRCR